MNYSSFPRFATAVVTTLLLSSAALAQEPSGDAKAAADLVTQYLQAVKAKKWAEAKKLIHPDTLKVIKQFPTPPTPDGLFFGQVR